MFSLRHFQANVPELTVLLNVGVQSSCLRVCSSSEGDVTVKVTRLCPTLCDALDFMEPSDFSVHRIPQARTLDWVAIPFSKGSSWLRDGTRASCIVAGRFFPVWATREAQKGASGFAFVLGLLACLYTIKSVLTQIPLPCDDFFFPNQKLGKPANLVTSL